MQKQFLAEYQKPHELITELAESIDISGQKQKDLYLKGIFIEGDVRNANGRIYPRSEIQRAVQTVQEQLDRNISVFGELNHPADLTVNLANVSHVITQMVLEGANGIGKLKIVPTPLGNIAKTLLENKCVLGVSSRGSGNVNESNGYVSDFELVTIDIVASPSAPNARPEPIYESLMNRRNAGLTMEMAAEVNTNKKVQKYLQAEMIRFIQDLDLKRKA